MQTKIETLRAKNSLDEEYLIYPKTITTAITNENADTFEDIVIEIANQAIEDADIEVDLSEYVKTETLDNYAKTEDIPDVGKFVTTSVNNLENYYTKLNTYSKTEVNSMLSSISTLNIESVTSLPSEDISTTTIYLFPKAETEEQNVYLEYINLDGTENGWECIGDTKVDLSNYVTTENLTTALLDYYAKNETYSKTEINTLFDELIVDSSLSDVSENPVQNKVVNKAINANATNITTNKANITNLTDGTTPAGNAKKLNGLTAEEFVNNGNMAINTNFLDPVNSSGATSWTGKVATIDKWMIGTVYGSAELTEEGLKLTYSGTTGTTLFVQTLPQDLSYFVGKTVTISAKADGIVSSLTFTFPSEFTDTMYDGPQVTIGTGSMQIDCIKPTNTNTMQFRVIGWVSESCILEWMKIEPSAVATPYVPPNKEVEKLKCGAVAYIGASGARNLISYPYTETNKTTNGITWVDNGDGTFTATGTATADSGVIIKNFSIPAGTYTISGTPKAKGCAIQLASSGDWSMSSWEGDSCTQTYTDTKSFAYCRLLVTAGTTVDNVVFAPMLELGSITHDFVPYHSGGAEDAKTVNGIAMYSSLSEVGLSGAVTIADVFTALPNKCELHLSNNKISATTYVSDAPKDYGFLTLKKSSLAYGEATFMQVNGTVPPILYNGTWHATNGWTGWKNASDGGNADTVDGYHASELAKYQSVAYSEIDNIASSGLYKTTGTPGLMLHITWDENYMFQIRNPYTENMIWRIKHSGEWGSWNFAAKQTDLSNYLPLDGSVPMSGSVLNIANKKGCLEFIGGHVNVIARSVTEDGNVDTAGNVRIITVYSASEQSDFKKAFQCVDYVNNVRTAYTILHTGNSNAVVADSAAPTDTSALWVDTANKVIKMYIDGAWTQVS